MLSHAFISVLIILASLSPARVDRTAPLNQRPLRVLQVGLAYGNTLRSMDDTALDAALSDAVEVGARWIRADLSWADVQPRRFNEYDWQAFDRIVKMASAKHLAVLAVMAYTPAWARPPGCNSEKCGPKDPAQFAEFASRAARRYSKYRVNAWEIWNEPNTDFWQPRPNLVEYTKLLKLTRAAMFRVQPDATLLLGGLAAVPTDSKNISQTDFLAGVCKLGGNKLVAGIGYHPYTYPYLPSYHAPWQTAWNKIDGNPMSLRAILEKYGTPHLPIWLTEYGAPTGGPGAPSDGSPSSITPATTHVTEALQAKLAADAVATATTNPVIHALIWFSDQDADTSNQTRENFYGLRRADRSAKPAFSALRSAITRIR